MDKMKWKIINSWISLISGISPFLYIAIGVLYRKATVSPLYFSMLNVWLFRLILLVAIFSGIYGLLGKVNRATRVRSIVGVSLVFLLWVTVRITFTYFVE